MPKISGNGSQNELKLPGRSGKNFVCNFNHSYLAIRMVKLHKNFITCFHTSLVQDPMVGILKKLFLSVLCSMLWNWQI